MSESNLIHIKLENSEAIQGKKDILNSEVNIIQMAQTIRKYRSLRSKELKTKAKLHRELKEVITGIKKLNQILPKIKIPKILKEENVFEEDGSKKKRENPQRHSKTQDIDLEIQLKEIQNQLKKLQ